MCEVTGFHPTITGLTADGGNKAGWVLGTDA